MGELLGALAGGGMLLLVGLLILRFLREIGAMRAEACRALLRTAGMALLTGTVYWLAGALLSRVLRGTLESAAAPEQVFSGPAFQRMLYALEYPEWTGPLSGLFAHLGHAVGAALFGRYVLGGVVLCFLCAMASACLIRFRLAALLGDENADRLTQLMLCLPGAALCFVPGGVCLGLLLASMLFFFLGKLLPARSVVLPPAAYDTALAVSMVLSTAVVLGMALGRIG